MKIEIEKDWCLDAAEREDGCEVGAGNPLGPLMALRLKLTGSQQEVERLKGVVGGQSDEIENRIEEFGIMSAEIARMTTEVAGLHGQITVKDQQIENLQVENSILRRDFGERGEIIQRLTAEGARKDVRIESLDEILEIAAVAISELVCLKDLKDKHGKTEKYLERQPEAWSRARSALTQVDHGPLFPLRESVQEALRQCETGEYSAKFTIDRIEVLVNEHKYRCDPVSGNQEIAAPDRNCCGFHKQGGDTYAGCWEPADSSQCALDDHECGYACLEQITPTHYKCRGCKEEFKWDAADQRPTEDDNA